MSLARLEQLTRELNTELFLAGFINETPICCWITDKNHKFIYANKALLKLTGLTEESDIIGKTNYDLWNKEDADKFTENDNIVLETGHHHELIELLTTDGYTHHFYSIKFRIDDLGVGGMAIDLNGSVKDLMKNKN